MVPIIEELVERLSEIEDDPRLSSLELAATAVDGSLIEAIPRMVWALWLDDDRRAVKLHLQYDLVKGIPNAATLTDGQGNERTVLHDILTAGRLYVLDRGYADYGLMADILEAKSSFVVRLRSNAIYEGVEERPIGPAAAGQGIVKDLVVRLGGEHTPPLHSHPIRLVEIRVRDEDKLMGRRRNKHVSRKAKCIRIDSTDHTLLLATDILDLDVELIALLYRRRWQIELFFRWFKKVLAADRLLALSEGGMTIVVYCALIASLLVVLWTGKKPTKRTFEMICFYFAGWVSQEELEAHLRRLESIDRKA